VDGGDYVLTAIVSVAGWADLGSDTDSDCRAKGWN